MDEHLKQIRDDVDAMNKALDVPEGMETTEAPGTEAPGTNAPATEVPSPTEAPSTGTPETEAPATEAPEEDDEIKKLKEENEGLRKKVEEMSGPKTSAPKTTAPVTDVPLEAIDFLKDLGEDIDLRDPETLNKILNAVHSLSVNTSRKVTSESLFKALPDVVKTNLATFISSSRGIALVSSFSAA